MSFVVSSVRWSRSCSVWCLGHGSIIRWTRSFPSSPTLYPFLRCQCLFLVCTIKHHAHAHVVYSAAFRHPAKVMRQTDRQKDRKTGRQTQTQTHRHRHRHRHRRTDTHIHRHRHTHTQTHIHTHDTGTCDTTKSILVQRGGLGFPCSLTAPP